jgi:hypothetical protein
VKKIAAGAGGDLPELRALLKKHERPAPPALPDSTPEPRTDGVLAA